MRNIRKINTKNCQYYTFNYKINIKKFDRNLLSIYKTSFKNTDAAVFIINYITMKSLDNENIDNENPLCLIFNNVDGYIIGCNSIEESNGYKYLIFAPTKDNKKVLQKYSKL